MYWLRRIIHKINSLKGELECYCHRIALEHGSSFTLIAIKGSISLAVFLVMFIPTWLGIGTFILISWASDHQFGAIQTFTGLIISITLIIPQLWLGIIGIGALLLIVLS